MPWQSNRGAALGADHRRLNKVRASNSGDPHVLLLAPLIVLPV